LARLLPSRERVARCRTLGARARARRAKAAGSVRSVRCDECYGSCVSRPGPPPLNPWHRTARPGRSEMRMRARGRPLPSRARASRRASISSLPVPRERPPMRASGCCEKETIRRSARKAPRALPADVRAHGCRPGIPWPRVARTARAPSPALRCFRSVRPALFRGSVRSLVRGPAEGRCGEGSAAAADRAGSRSKCRPGFRRRTEGIRSSFRRE